MITLTIILLAIPIILIIAVFTRKGISTEASIHIDRPQQAVFDYLVNLKNQEKFNAWLMLDPNMQPTYTGTDGLPGSAMAWASKNPKDGKGAQQLLAATAPEFIEIELALEKPMHSVARYQLELQQVNESQTKVHWSYQGNTAPYYLLRVSHILLQLKKRVTKYMNTSLDSLKKVLESQ